VFGAYGAAGSTGEVARRAGVGIATVFRHFPTKEELIEAALLRHFDQLTERAHALAAGTDPTVAWRTRTPARCDLRSRSRKVYLLIPGLAQASATMQTRPDTLDRAIDVVLTGLPPSHQAPPDAWSTSVA
jgi:AcrR family transcriptional regulator